MKSVYKKLRDVISGNYKLLIGIAIGMLITIPLGVYALSNNDKQNQIATKQSSNQNKTSSETSTPSTSTQTAPPSSSNQSTSSSSGGSKKTPSTNTPTTTTQNTVTLISCTNYNDVPYETHAVYHSSSAHITGVNGWSKNCVYSDGHTTKETYTQPITEYFNVPFQIPDYNNAKNQCTSLVGASHTQAIAECITIAMTDQ